MFTTIRAWVDWKFAAIIAFGMLLWGISTVQTFTAEPGSPVSGTVTAKGVDKGYLLPPVEVPDKYWVRIGGVRCAVKWSDFSTFTIGEQATINECRRPGR